MQGCVDVVGPPSLVPPCTAQLDFDRFGERSSQVQETVICRSMGKLDQVYRQREKRH